MQSLSAPGGLIDTSLCGPGSFGNGMAAANGLAVIANNCDSSVTPGAGAVHVYSVSEGNNEPLEFIQTLHNPQPGTVSYGFSSEVGSQSLSTDGFSILVGSSRRFLDPAREMEADLYELTSSGDLIHTESIATPDPGMFISTSFGISVNLMGNDEFVIARQAIFGEGGGKVYVYSHP